MIETPGRSLNFALTAQARANVRHGEDLAPADPRTDPGRPGPRPSLDAGTEAAWGYVSTWSDFAYTALVLDAFSRAIVGWRVATSLRADLARPFKVTVGRTDQHQGEQTGRDEREPDRGAAKRKPEAS